MSKSKIVSYIALGIVVTGAYAAYAVISLNLFGAAPKSFNLTPANEFSWWTSLAVPLLLYVGKKGIDYIFQRIEA